MSSLLHLWIGILVLLVNCSLCTPGFTPGYDDDSNSSDNDVIIMNNGRVDMKAWNDLKEQETGDKDDLDGDYGEVDPPQEQNGSEDLENGTPSYDDDDSNTSSDNDVIIMNNGRVDMKAWNDLKEKETGDTNDSDGDYGEVDPPPEENGSDDEENGTSEDDEDEDEVGGKRRRFLINNVHAQWDKGILPYKIGASFKPNQKKSFLNYVIPKYEYWTFFRFVEWNSSVPHLYGLSHQNYLNLINNHGCWSLVGNARKHHGQNISCCGGNACVHEIGHAIGFIHEQENPLRDDYIRINPENIVDGKGGNFNKKSPSKGIATFGYFDYSSIMEYGIKAFSKNKANTITVYDPDLEYLVKHADTSAFYMFYEAQKVYKMKEKRCPNFPIVCENDGYVSYINNTCKCRCPTGLNPDTGCATPLTADVWPEGSYSILKPVSGCPAGFEEGYVRLWTRQYPGTRHAAITTSASFHAAGRFSSTYLTHTFCTKTYSHMPNTAPTWQPGKYCIFRYNGTCPRGFSQKTVQYGSTESFNNKITLGTLPDMDDSVSLSLRFCCRNNRHVSSMSMPKQKPAILLQLHGSACQPVNGMNVTEESLTWSPYTIGLSHPIAAFGKEYETSLAFCYYTPVVKDITTAPCGDTIVLSDSNPEETITTQEFPTLYTGTKNCTWLIKGPKAGRVVLNFHAFNIGPVTNSGCKDKLEVRFALPGQPGVKYCGTGFDKTIVSTTNTLMLIMSQRSGSRSGFNASVSMVKDEDLCYTNQGKDGSYTGTANRGRQFEKCLPWDQATKCKHHMFNSADVNYQLESNYCRNPGSGTEPWCYTDAETCDRVYCDVCHLRKCYDLFADCHRLIQHNPNYCKSDGEAQRGCRKTCGFCSKETKALPVSSLTCPSPKANTADGKLISSHRVFYSVGDRATYKCNNSPDTQTSYCTSEGTWTEVNYACGACPTGWQGHKGYCYKFVDQSVTEAQAAQNCHHLQNGSSVSTTTSPDEVHFLVALSGHSRSGIWLGGHEINQSGKLTWEDGESVHWTNWKGKPWANHGKKYCIYLDGRSLKWVNIDCHAHHKYVCKYKPSARSLCLDQRNDCDILLERNPDMCVKFKDSFAWSQCAKTCGVCRDHTHSGSLSSTYCSNVGSPINVILRTRRSNTTPGQFIRYHCKDAYVLASGDLTRACTATGHFTGTPPICKAINDTDTNVNEVEIKRRGTVGKGGLVYTAKSSLMTIHRSGEVKAWLFYSNYAGTVALQVWKPVGNSTMFVLVGENVISDTKVDRKMRVDIASTSRIHVQPGDLIGIYYPTHNRGGISYDACKSQYYPSGGNQYIISHKMASVSRWHVGSKYRFKSVTDCRTFSLNAVIGPEDVKIQEPRPGEVEVAIQCVSLCGSDTYFWSKAALGIYEIKEPGIMGHEGSAVVTKVGNDVKRLKVGDRVTIEMGNPCMQCKRCKQGRSNVCLQEKAWAPVVYDGLITRNKVLPEKACHVLPDNVSDEVGAMIEPFAVAVHACRRANIEIGEKVFITGSGPIGLMCLMVARAMGLEDIVITDINQERLELAKKLGAKYTLVPKDMKTEDIENAIVSSLGEHPDVTFECSGNAFCQSLALQVTSAGGRCVLVGVSGVNVTLPLAFAQQREVDIISLFRYDPMCYPIAIDLAAKGKVDLQALISHRYPLEETREGVIKATSREPGVVKIMIDCRKK